MSKEIKIGISVLVILVIFFWGFNFLKGQSFFDPNKRHFFVKYKNIQGLQKSSPVLINGLEVGKVSDIYFNPQERERGGLIVKISLKNDFLFSKNSVAKIYSSSLLGGKSLAIIPDYESVPAISNDTLKGEVESGIFASVEQKLNPLQAKLESVIVSADSIFKGANDILNIKTRESLKRSVYNFEYTVADIRTTVNRIKKYIDSNSVDLKTSIKHAEKITENLAKVSDTLASVKIGEIMKEAKRTLISVNTLLKDVNSGNGTIGKLIKNDSLYNNLTAASKELEELLREMKLNPKRFVHFSLFGKKAKPYKPEKNKENTSGN